MCGVVRGFVDPQHLEPVWAGTPSGVQVLGEREVHHVQSKPKCVCGTYSLLDRLLCVCLLISTHHH